MRHYEWIMKTEMAQIMSMPDRAFERAVVVAVDAIKAASANPETETGEKEARRARDEIAKFYGEGGNVLVLTPAEQDVLASIDLSSVVTADLFLPHRSVYFDLTGSSMQIAAMCPDGTVAMVPARGAYVTSEVISYEVRGQPAETQIWGIHLWGTTGQSIDDSGDLWVPVPFESVKDGRMEEFVSGFLDLAADALNMPRDARFETNRATSKRVLRMVINAVLYWTSPEARVVPDASKIRAQQLWRDLARAKSPGKKKEIQRRLDAVSKVSITRFDLGSCEQGGRDHARRGPVRRHKVSAHWSHFWVTKAHPLFDRGTNETEGKRRIRRLVMEHWRGESAAGIVVSRVHSI